VDLALMLRVLSRFRLLVAGGVLLAFGLMFLAVFRVNPTGHPTLQFREKQQWSSYATLFVTQPGFPWGRAVTSGDPSRFGTYATLYARLATADGVRRAVKHSVGLTDKELLEAQPVLASDFDTNSPPLPLVKLTAVGATRARAQQLANAWTAAFTDYIGAEQQANRIPTDQRVLVQTVSHAQPAELLKGRSKTLPVVIFMTVLLATFGTAFVLENLRPRVRPVAAVEDAPPAADAA
jgi:hypothetical protein